MKNSATQWEELRQIGPRVLKMLVTVIPVAYLGHAPPRPPPVTSSRSVAPNQTLQDTTATGVLVKGHGESANLTRTAPLPYKGKPAAPIRSLGTQNNAA